MNLIGQARKKNNIDLRLTFSDPEQKIGFDISCKLSP